MASLIDVGMLTEVVKVKVRGVEKEIDVAGVSAGDIFYLMNEFPEIRAVMEKNLSNISVEKLMKMGTKVIGLIIGFGTVFEDREEKDAMKRVLKSAALAERYPISIQLKLIDKIFSCTFVEDIGPFVEELTAMKARFIVTTKTSAGQPGTSSKPRRAALQMDSQDKRHGPAHRAH